MGESENIMSSQFSRRSFLSTGAKVAGTAALAGLVPSFLDAAPASAASLKSMAYQLSWVKDAEFAGTFLADKMGFYKKHGLSVNILAGGASVVPEPVVVSGKCLVASSAADACAQAIAQGAPLKIIGVRYQKNPYCIISLAKSPIKTPQDLYGKKLGVSAANEVPWQTFVKITGIDASKINVVPVQFDPTPLATGDVDAWMGFITSEPGQLQVKGVKIRTWLFADFGYAVYSDLYEVTEETLNTKEEELVSFMKAEKQGWTYNFANINKGTTTAMSYAKSSGLQKSQQLLENTAQKALIETPYTKAHGLFTMDPKDIEDNIKTLAQGGIKATAAMFSDKIVKQI
ncbi:MAG TPA: ABC transporter substrate-binding protein [Acidimicrobiales bacterium]|jgi:ABC-type nitrate/sulfonate/bicarbonate transport system substrate-binding protein|nr:ABC transporter substrate-binding protein [Acidimicrobiales bacterium]